MRTSQTNTTLSTSISSEGSLRDSLGQARPGPGSSLAHQQQSHRLHPATAVPSFCNKGRAQGKGKRATVPQVVTSPQQSEQQKQMTRQPTHRYTTKTSPPTTTAIPHAKGVKTTAACWIRQGRYWKRVHIQSRTAFYIPEQTDDGPDISNLKPWRQTLAVATRIKQRATAMKTIGQTSRTKLYNTNGQDPPTSKRTWTATRSTRQMKNTDHNTQQCKQQGSQNRSNQQHGSKQSTNSHSCHTEHGATSVFAQKANPTAIQDRKATSQSYRSTSHTSVF